MPQEEILLIGGPGHGKTALVPEGGNEVRTSEADRYVRRTMRFMARNPSNPRSLSLRRYWATEVMVHEAIAGDIAEAFGWWQSLADARLAEQYGREVTGDPAEVAKFHPNLTGG